MLQPNNHYVARIDGRPRVVLYLRTKQRGKYQGWHSVALYNPRSRQWDRRLTIKPDQITDRTPKGTV
jgi:hypothetical protein